VKRISGAQPAAVLRRGRCKIRDGICATCSVDPLSCRESDISWTRNSFIIHNTIVQQEMYNKKCTTRNVYSFVTKMECHRMCLIQPLPLYKGTASNYQIRKEIENTLLNVSVTSKCKPELNQVLTSTSRTVALRGTQINRFGSFALRCHRHITDLMMAWAQPRSSI